jgi:hypothetical protein
MARNKPRPQRDKRKLSKLRRTASTQSKSKHDSRTAINESAVPQVNSDGDPNQQPTRSVHRELNTFAKTLEAIVDGEPDFGPINSDIQVRITYLYRVVQFQFLLAQCIAFSLGAVFRPSMLETVARVYSQEPLKMLDELRAIALRYYVPLKQLILRASTEIGSAPISVGRFVGTDICVVIDRLTVSVRMLLRNLQEPKGCSWGGAGSQPEFSLDRSDDPAREGHTVALGPDSPTILIPNEWKRVKQIVGPISFDQETVEWVSSRIQLECSAALSMLGRQPVSAEQVETIFDALRTKLEEQVHQRVVSQVTPRQRIVVDQIRFIIQIDGKPYPLPEGETVKARMAAFFQALIDAKGSCVSASSYALKPRNVEKLPKEILDLLVVPKPVAGHTIPYDTVWRS